MIFRFFIYNWFMNNNFSFLLTEFLQILKKQFGITTKLLSKDLDISPNTFTNWKKNSNRINKKLLNRFSIYIDDFKEDNLLLVKSNDSLKSIIESLQLEISKICGKSDFEPLNNRKKLFQINFNNLIVFIKKAANLYEFDYENESSNYFRVQGYQRQEVFDNLVSLNLISRNNSGRLSVQKNLAKLLGVSEGQISRWKKGLDYPSIYNLKKIARLCNINNDFPLSSYKLDNENFPSLFLKSSYNRMHIQEFEREYLFKIRYIIENSGYKNIFEKEIINDYYLISYEDEDLEQVKMILFRDCIMLLKKTFDVLDFNILFEDWLIKKIKSKEVTIYSFKNTSIELNTVDDCYKHADKIDYGYKVLSNYLDYNASFDPVSNHILNQPALFALTSVFLSNLHKENKNFSDWLEFTAKIFINDDFSRELCINICNSLSTRKTGNSLDYIDAFFKQFWNLVIYKNYSVVIDQFPNEKVYAEISTNGDGILLNIQNSYNLMKKTIEKINRYEIMITESNLIRYYALKYLEDGKELFEEILYNDAFIEYEKKYLESKGDFEIVEELSKMNKKVEQFTNKWNMYSFN